MKLQVWNIINMPSDPIYKEVVTVREGYDYIEKEARRQLKIRWIDNNAFGLEQFDEDEQVWVEWQDEVGNDLNEYARLQGWE